MTRAERSGRSEGFTLVEVVVALLVLTTAATAAASLVIVSLETTRAAQLQTSVTTLAVEKVEQLRSLTWMVVEGVPMSDTTTALSVDPPVSGGTGLSPSPPGTLTRDTAGYVDYLAPSGVWVAGGSTPPPDAAFVRRWSIESLAEDPLDTLVLRVFVAPVARARATSGDEPRAGVPGEALVATLLTRKAR